jgi:hypothetical protein
MPEARSPGRPLVLLAAAFSRDAEVEVTARKTNPEVGGLFQLFNVSAGEAGALRILENYGANGNLGVKGMF